MALKKGINVRHGMQFGEPGATSASELAYDANTTTKEKIDALATTVAGKQDALTFDTVPTDGSNNPVKSNGIYDSEKDIYAAMGEMGAKNLISYPWYDTTKSVNGVTFTANTDGTISVVTDANGATANTVFNLHTRGSGESNDLVVKNGNYILTGCPSGGSNEKYRLTINVSKNGSAVDIAKDFGNGVSVTLDGDDYSQTHTNIGVFIFVTAGATITTPITFKPMLRLASDTDNTYQPYAKTNKQLTDDVALLDSGKADLTDLAPAFSTSTAYTVGQYVSYDGNLYKCTSAHSAGAWAAGDFTLVAVGSELSELNSNLTSLLAGVLLTYQTTPGSNPFATGGTGVVIEIKRGDTLLGYLVLRPAGYLDSNNKPAAIELYDTEWNVAWSVARITD